MKEHGVAGQKLGVDFIDINMINVFKENNINWVDGMTPMMEARAVKSPDEQEASASSAPSATPPIGSA